MAQKGPAAAGLRGLYLRGALCGAQGYGRWASYSLR